MRQFFPSGLWEGSSLQTLWTQDGRDRECRWGTLWKQDQEFPTVRWPGLSSRWVWSPWQSWQRHRTYTAAWRETSGRCLAALPCPVPQTQLMEMLEADAEEVRYLKGCHTQCLTAAELPAIDSCSVILLHLHAHIMFALALELTPPAAVYQRLHPWAAMEILPSEHSSLPSLCWWGLGQQSPLRHRQYLVETQTRQHPAPKKKPTHHIKKTNTNNRDGHPALALRIQWWVRGLQFQINFKALWYTVSNMFCRDAQ